MPPKSKSFHKKGKIATSFRRNKISPIKSGKKFKLDRKMKKKMRKSICDSSFNLSNLSKSAVSTPVGVRGLAGKRKAAPVNLEENSVLISGGVHNDTIETANKSLTKIVPEPVAKKIRIAPPENRVVTRNIGDMFRNDYVVKPGILTKQSTSQTVMGISDESEKVIVIDDDDDDHTSSAVEELGEEMLKIVQVTNPSAVGQTVPDTPRTILKKLDNANHNDTIVLDDSINEDTIVVVDDDDNWPPLPVPVPLQSKNMQDVINRYPVQTADFIPLGGGACRTSERGRKRGRSCAGRSSRGQPRVRGRNAGEYLPKFTVGAPNTQFIGAPVSNNLPRVYRFTGRGGGAASKREQQGKVVSEGPTMYVGEQQDGEKTGLRPIVIDGSNVAMAHGLNQVFSSRGIELVVKYFSARGHTNIKAFVPQFRAKPSQSNDKELLDSMYKEGHLVFTPSREVGNTRITSYDDTFILDYAAMHGGVVVTRDNYRDLANEKAEWKEVVRRRILMPTFVGDDLMFPHDPLGRNGPCLDQFLAF